MLKRKSKYIKEKLVALTLSAFCCATKKKTRLTGGGEQKNSPHLCEILDAIQDKIETPSKDFAR